MSAKTIVGILALVMVALVAGFLIGQPTVINLAEGQEANIINEQVSICETRLVSEEKQTVKDLKALEIILSNCRGSNSKLIENTKLVISKFTIMENKFENRFADLNDSVFDFNAGIDEYFNDLNQANQERFEDLNQAVYDTNKSIYKTIIKEC